MTERLRVLTAAFGLSSVTIFLVTFAVFAFLRPDFDVFADFISGLGSRGQPFAVWWNGIGFAAVGLCLAAFGWLYGLCRQDRLLGVCLVVAGLGFALAAIPTDPLNKQGVHSKAHFLSVCLSLAGFSLGLARLSGPRASRWERTSANWVIVLTLVPVICVPGGISAEPLAHRIILLVVFGWVVTVSCRLLNTEPNTEVAQ